VLTDFNYETQHLFLDIMIVDPEAFIRVRNIYNPENFDRNLRDVAKFLATHTDDHKTLPSPQQLAALFNYKVTDLPPSALNEGRLGWFMKEFEKFTKRRELERAIGKSVDLLEKGDFEPVEKLIKDAVQIALTKDLGTDYFVGVRERLEALRDNTMMLSTGWDALDKLLYGGFNRGELQIFAGGSGSGKSLVMQNLALNWLEKGLNGVYITLELSEGLCSKRIDSMLSEVPTWKVLNSIDQVETAVSALKFKYGSFRVKYMPAQSNVNDIRAYLKELQIQTGWKVDFICIDYLDLLMPVSAKVSPSDLFVKDKYVSEELRNLAGELGILCVTASQLNRSAVEEIEFDHSHISGGISKINTADNVFGIFTSRAMRERGRYQIQAMKTRSSAGVGMKIELGYNNETLRIFNLDVDDDDNHNQQKSSIMGTIRQSTSTATDDDDDDDTKELAKVAGNVQGSKLKGLLNQIKR